MTENILLTFRVLMWAIDIVTSHNDYRKFETLLVRVDKHFCGSLACSVWVGGRKNARLQQIIRIISDLSIDFIGRDVDELFDSVLLRTL